LDTYLKDVIKKAMSKQAIHEYYSRLDQYKRFGGTKNESSIRRAFANLLEEYCVPKNLVLVDELALKTSRKRPDGTVKDALQLDWGHWESKDPADDLDGEIRKKLELGYPKFNIIFENSQEIVLIQQGREIMRCGMKDADALHAVLTAFVSYQRPEIKEFHLAVEKFRADIPDIAEALRSMIAKEEKTNQDFRRERGDFRKLCRKSIHPEISDFDIQEMLIQHILTAEIFDTVFGDSHFHRENNIAKKLETVVNTFFTGTLRRNTLSGIDSYYRAIKAEAARIDNHHEKQKFLKVIYENFYKAYNPKGADRLGIVYTPNEIVKFMIEGTDWLLERHFGKSLADRDVEILDPATGTGTFITEIIEHIPPQYLEHKYRNEMHANEIAILPYYIACLNIEYTWQQKMGRYEPFENIVFVDTLDNPGFDHEYKGKQKTLRGFGLSAENPARIKKQNEKKISVIIGNPPYNAKQQIYSDFNPNRKYRRVDDRIRETYIRQGTAQNQTAVYDMYTRFFRWAGDRIDENGIIAFVTNRSYIDSRTLDGFRRTAAEEFDDIYIVDTLSDVRKNPSIAGTTHNVFGIQTGVAVAFLVKTAENSKKKAGIHYFSLTDEMRKNEKLEWFRENRISRIPFRSVIPDRKNNWLHMQNNDFDEFVPLADREVKAGKSKKALFELYSGGVKSQRDDWVYDFSKENLIKKMKCFADVYQKTVINKKFRGRNTIKWDRELTKYMERGIEKVFEEEKILRSLYRPFTKKYFYFDRHFNGMTYQWFSIFRPGEKTRCIAFNVGSNEIIHLAADTIVQGGALLTGGGSTQAVPEYCFGKDGTRISNVTDWGLKQFTTQYQNENISREDIFHYAYGVLHNPAYRKKYETNLKREFPRIPFYRDFRKWADWGKELADLHISYENADPYPLEIHEIAHKENPKAKLRAAEEKGEIILDENTSLSGIPDKAWEYRLGTRSALHWILDQYREKTPKDKTVAEQFNTYRFADYKETVTDLLKRVCTVSVKTADIMTMMEKEEPHI